MVDVHQPYAAPYGKQGHPPAADDHPANSRNGAGTDSSVKPVVVGPTRPSDLPVLVRSGSLGADTYLMDPWVLSENDVQWLIFLGKKRYGERFDYLTVEAWFRNVVLKSPLMFYPIRTANAFLISMLSCVPWTPNEFECNLVFVCADDGAMWEAAKLLRASIAWAKMRKCKRWRMSSDTDFDIAPIARRLGETEITPRFCIEL